MKEQDEHKVGTNDVAERPDPVRRLAECGWLIEPTGCGGMRIATHGALRVGVFCVSLVLLMVLSLFAWFMVGLVSRMDWPQEENLPGLVPTLALMALLGGLGLPFAGVLAHVGWLLFVREEWIAGHSSLQVHRRLFGLRWGSEYRDGQLVLEPHYAGREKAFWRLAVKNRGQKNYLIHQRSISERGTGIGFESPRREAEAMAELLSHCTGWPVVSAQQEANEAIRSTTPPAELPAALRNRGFRAGVDEQLRLEIVRPRRTQIGCGSVALLIASIWLLGVGAAVHSFTGHVGGVQEVLTDWPFLLLITPMLVGGVVIALLGFVVIMSRERWIVDRNLIVVRSSFLGWKSEQQYVDGAINLTRVRTKHDDHIHWTWEIQLHDHAGQVLKKNLYNARDDDIPRQLAAVLSHHTGWSLSESES